MSILNYNATKSFAGIFLVVFRWTASYYVGSVHCRINEHWQRLNSQMRKEGHI